MATDAFQSDAFQNDTIHAIAGFQVGGQAAGGGDDDNKIRVGIVRDGYINDGVKTNIGGLF